MARGQQVLWTGGVGAGFSLSALIGHRWWDHWEAQQHCQGMVFSECLDQALEPIWWGVLVLCTLAWAALRALRVERRGTVLLCALPLNLAAASIVVAIDAGARWPVVVLASGLAWALAAVVAIVGREPVGTVDRRAGDATPGRRRGD